LLLVSLFCGIVVCKNLLTIVWNCLIQYLTALTEAKGTETVKPHSYQRNVKNIFYRYIYSFF